MSPPGAKPKPTAFKLIAGTYRADRDGARADVRVPGTVAVLAPLAPLSDLEQRYFDHYRTHAVPGAHGAVDSHLFTQIARVAARLDDADDKVTRFGMVMKHPKTGRPEIQPYQQAAMQLRDQLRKLLSEAGLTPSSRTRLHGATGDDTPPGGTWDDIDG